MIWICTHNFVVCNFFTLSFPVEDPDSSERKRKFMESRNVRVEFRKSIYSEYNLKGEEKIIGPYGSLWNG